MLCRLINHLQPSPFLARDGPLHNPTHLHNDPFMGLNFTEWVWSAVSSAQFNVQMLSFYRAAISLAVKAMAVVNSLTYREQIRRSSQPFTLAIHDDTQGQRKETGQIEIERGEGYQAHPKNIMPQHSRACHLPKTVIQTRSCAQCHERDQNDLLEPCIMS